MRTTLIILAILTLIGCNNTEKKKTSQNGRFELVPEVDKSIKQKIKHEQKDTIPADTAYIEYLGERLEPIKQNFKRIHRIKDWTRTGKKRLNESAEGGEATYYFHKDTLLKVIAVHFGETGKLIREFYTMDGELSFVFEKIYNYKRPITRDSTAMKENNDTQVFETDELEVIEERSYFENGTLIHQINNQDCGSPFAQDYLQEEQNRLIREFEKLLNHIKK